jgi:16S rRNA C1402 (ribose-2'-O) methylase RsmI
MDDEEIFYGTARELFGALGGSDKKGEFVIVIEGRNLDRPRR